MTIQENLFCYYYSRLRDVKEAAVKAGYSEDKAYVIGLKLLCKDKILDQIEECYYYSPD